MQEFPFQIRFEKRTLVNSPQIRSYTPWVAIFVSRCFLYSCALFDKQFIFGLMLFWNYYWLDRVLAVTSCQCPEPDWYYMSQGAFLTEIWFLVVFRLPSILFWSWNLALVKETAQVFVIDRCLESNMAAFWAMRIVAMLSFWLVSCFRPLSGRHFSRKLATTMFHFCDHFEHSKSQLRLVQPMLQGSLFSTCLQFHQTYNSCKTLWMYLISFS